MTNTGAKLKSLSNDLALRSPIPEIIKLTALPLDHPGRSITSCNSAARLGV